MALHIARASFRDSAQCPPFIFMAITHRVKAAQVKTLLKLICAFNGNSVLKWDVVRRIVAVLLSWGNPEKTLHHWPTKNWSTVDCAAFFLLFKGHITVIVRCAEISGFTPLCLLLTHAWTERLLSAKGFHARCSNITAWTLRKRKEHLSSRTVRNS